VVSVMTRDDYLEAIYVCSYCYTGGAGGECDDPRRLLRAAPAR
jgi:hypothetical protein